MTKKHPFARLAIIASVVATAGGAFPAFAAFTNLGSAGGYNVYTIGNFTQSGTDAGGSVAVGGYFAPAGNGSYTVAGSVYARGDYTNSGGTIGGNLVGRNVTFSNETVNGTVSATNNVTISGGSQPSAISYVGTANLPNYYTNAPAHQIHQVQSTSIAYPVDFDATATYLRSLTSTLESTTTGGTTVSFAYNNLSLTGTGKDFYVFHVTAAQLAGMSNFALSVSPATSGTTPTVVIDVDGSSNGAYSFHNNAIALSGTDEYHTLFNFADATTLTTNGIGIKGSLLAPYADVNFNGGNINGTMIANNLYGSGEAHSYAFSGALPATVPEPASLASALGAGAMLFVRRRRPG